MRFQLLYCMGALLLGNHANAQVLTLQDVIASAERNYPLIQSSIADAKKAEAEAFSAQGGFDPSLKTTYINDFGGYYKNTYTDVALEQPTPFWGTRVYTGWRNGQGNFPIYDAKMPTFTGGEFRAGIEVPLLKNGGIDERRTKVRGSEQASLSAQENVKAQRVDVVKQASQKYWDWVAAGQKIAVAKELLEIALDRDEAIRKKVKHGDLPEMDRIDNRRSVLQRQSGVVAAERAFQKASFELSLFYRDESGSPQTPVLEELPKTLLADNFKSILNEIDQKSRQLNNHPELKKLGFQANQIQLDYRLAENQILPRLDFQIGVYSDLGVNPGTNYLPPSNYPTEFRTSFTLEFPLFFRTPRGKLSASLAAIDKMDATQTLALNKLEVQLKDSIAAMKAANARLELARNEIELAKKLESMERVRAYHGDSSILIVNLREQTTRDAMMKEIEAFTDFHKAKADYEACMAGG